MLRLCNPFILQQIRTKTFRKTPTKAYLRKLEWVGQQKALGNDVQKPDPQQETKFFKILGNMKVYKSVSPGSTHRRHGTKFHLHKGSCIQRLSVGKRSTGGRNNTGRITVRHRGGGHKKRIRFVDFHRLSPVGQQVVRFEYDPNRSAELCLMRNLATNEFSYIIRPVGVEIGQILYSYRQGIQSEDGQEISKAKLIQPGNCLLIRDIPVGTRVHCLGLKADGPAQLVRSAGTSAQIVAMNETHAQVRLSSQEVRMISIDACATIGSVANEHHKLRVWGKAGARRRKGIRPAVRGIAMSPVDHPHGGGSKSKGGKAPRSVWGWKTKGPKTVRRKRWFIVTPRWRAKMN
ncbi:translation protein SH3-like domain-containing protein [Gorgonomyces haynaldii]|nr:translation protein SH3-like domain-containing protein [Gorgonomyces haynaldii]